jgi:type I restriction enzyme, S subunit
MNLPAGWCLTTVGEICSALQYGYTASATTDPVGPRFLRITDIQDGIVQWDFVPFCEIETGQIDKYSLNEGDIVFARTGGTVGKSYIIDRVPQTAVFASYLIRLSPAYCINPRFLYYFFQSASYWEQIGLKKGGLQGNVNATTLSSLIIPLCPIQEQQRIVAKIEELLSELDKGIENLTVAREQLKVFRQSLLKYAFEGKLTTQLRIGRGQNDVEWPIRSLGHIAAVTGGLTKNPSRNSHTLKMKYLRVANVYADCLELEEVSEIGVTPEEYDTVALSEGDLLVVEGNGSLEQIGRVAMWGGQLKEVGHQNHLIRVRFKEGACPRFFLLFLLSPKGRELIVRQASSTSGLHTLSISKVSGLSVPVPSLPEQEKVLDALAAPLSEIGRLSEGIEVALARSNGLRQSILRRAFAGRLVSQDTSDEPSSALLERICAERAANYSKTKKPKQPKQRTNGEAA